MSSRSIYPIALMLIVVACGGAPQRGETLIESVRTYNDGVRWQRFAAAASRLPAAERSRFVDEWDARSDDLRITDYEIINVVQASAHRAVVQIKLSWYRESEGTLHDTHAVQTWEQRGPAWFLVEESRSRGDETPWLVEPAPAASTPGIDAATDAPPSHPSPSSPSSPPSSPPSQ